MKVLFVNCVYSNGSTGKIMCDIVRGLSDSDIIPIVAYGRGTRSYNGDEYVVKLAPEWIMKLQSLASKITGFSYGCSPLSTHALYRLIEREKPDIVNLHCVNANTVNFTSVISYLKKRGIQTVLSIHAEFPYTGGCSHAYECEQWRTGCEKCKQFKAYNSQLPISYFFDKAPQFWQELKNAYNDFYKLTIVCVSPWLSSRAMLSPFFKNRTILTINNGLNTDIFRPRNPERLLSHHKLHGKKVILHVTPDFYSTLKGGRYVLEIASRMEIENPEYRIIVCGYNGDGSDLPSNVIPVKFTQNQEELSEYYSLANITLLTSKRETFSMVVAESLCCGTPVVGFEAGGPESIAIAEYSRFVSYGDVDSLYNEIISSIENKKFNSVDINQAIKIYSLQTMAEEYKKLFKKLSY